MPEPRASGGGDAPLRRRRPIRSVIAGRRLALWERCLGVRLPRDGDLDLGFCAERFGLSGGSIRACAVTAAYLAAESGAPVTMRQVVTAVAQEYRKLGRLVLEAEFGAWLGEVGDV